MNLKNFAVLALLLSLHGCVATTAPPIDAEIRRKVMATEAAFAQTMADRDFDAFATFIASDAVFFSGDNPLRGKQQIVDLWARYYVAAGAPFSWQPEEVEVLDSGTLAHSSGPVHAPDGKLIGRFTSIWRRNSAGAWKIIFDKGSDVCDCASE